MKKRYRKSYRDIIDMLPTIDSVVELLNLERIPHFTTLQKAFQRINGLWSILIIQIKPLIAERLDYIAIDSSGFSDPYSYYYRKWI